MNLPYRTRRILKRIAVILLAVVLTAILAGALWFLWLQRFVVYTRDGALLDMNLPAEVPAGQTVSKPKKPEKVTIYYNEGDNAINTSKELTQITGYYADTAALSKGPEIVLAQAQALPTGTPVMIDVKSPKGSFYYSSLVGTGRYFKEDKTAAMDELIAYLGSSDLYAIARLPALRDYAYGLNHVPDGLPTAGGYLWADDDYCYWLNPGSQGTITYLMEIVTELKNLGFDEVVLDEFYFPDTKEIVYKADKAETLASAAKTLVTTCTTDNFALSFVGQDTGFVLPEGRSRLYMEGVAAANAALIAQQTGLANPAVNLVFLTEVHDTRFDAYSVLRPLEAAH